MKSNSIYAQQARKNLPYHADEKHTGPTTNLNNYSSGRLDKNKYVEDKSSEKFQNNQTKIDNKMKNKN